VIATSRGSFRNPPGFYIHVLEDNIAPPVQAKAAPAKKNRTRVEPPGPQDGGYRSYQTEVIDRHIREELGTERFEQMVAEKAKELKRTVGTLTAETIRDVSIATVRAMLLKTVPHVSAEEFGASRRVA